MALQNTVGHTFLLFMQHILCDWKKKYIIFGASEEWSDHFWLYKGRNRV